MDISLKSPSEIEKMRAAGAATARVLEMIEPYIVPGVTTNELDKIMNDYIEQVENAKSADLGYQGYPKATCISINEVVCHGIPDNHKLREGDIVNIDVTVLKDKYHGDSPRMYIVGRTALRELAVAVHTDLHDGTVHVVLVGYEHLTEVVGLTGLLENLALEETDGGISPAGTAAVLVLYTGDRQLLNSCEHRLVGIFLLLCRGAERKEGYKRQN